MPDMIKPAEAALYWMHMQSQDKSNEEYAKFLQGTHEWLEAGMFNKTPIAQIVLGYVISAGNLKELPDQKDFNDSVRQACVNEMERIGAGVPTSIQVELDDGVEDE
jgi:hypothetical protein